MHRASVAILSSGSVGNSILVESDGRAVLIDAGISCRELEKRMSVVGVEPTQVEAIVLTHEHADHMRGARRFCSEHHVPVYATKGTLALTPLDGTKRTVIAAGHGFEIGQLRLRPFKVRHLAAEPVAFTIISGSKKIGIASDLGSITTNVIEEMSESDLILVEANYDEKMLLAGTYPEFLKRAIRGDHGHLSNADAGALSAKAAAENTEKVVLVHLSKENNTPEKARETVTRSLERAKLDIKLEVTEHGAMNGPFSLR